MFVGHTNGHSINKYIIYESKNKFIFRYVNYCKDNKLLLKIARQHYLEKNGYFIPLGSFVTSDNKQDLEYIINIYNKELEKINYLKSV